jgi:predicted SAM-dependent methyltransferase
VSHTGVVGLARVAPLWSNHSMTTSDDVGHPTDPGDDAPAPGTMSLQEYLDAQAGSGGHSTIPLSDLVRPFMSPAVRLRAKQVATALELPRARRRAREQTASPLRLHLGSGGNNLPGWVNIDLVGARADVAWDLRRPLPFADRQADAVFLEHVLEHMTVAEGMAVLRHAFRVLAPGGVIRVGVPDAGLYARSYAGGDRTIDELRPGRPTRMLALGEVFQEHGHVSAWDGETLALVVDSVGFADAEVMPGGESRLEPAPDSPVRIPETVYVEAVVPGA